MRSATSWDVNESFSNNEKTSSFIPARNIAEYQKLRANSFTCSAPKSTGEPTWFIVPCPYSILTVGVVGDPPRLAEAATHTGGCGVRSAKIKTFGNDPEGLNGFAQRGGEEENYGSQGTVCFRRDRAVNGFERRPSVLRTALPEWTDRSAINSG